MVVGSPMVLNLIPGGVMPVMMINETDKGYKKEFLIYNGAAPYNLPSNVSATIRGTKRDGYGVTEAAEVTAGSNLVRITVTEQMTAVPGPNIFELVFVDTVSLKVSTANFIMMVERAALNSNTVISDSDIAYAEQVLDQLQSVAAFGAQLNALKDNKVQKYDNVSQMTGDYELTPGMYALTGGYHAVNDNGGALYRIYYGAPTGKHYETLSNGYYAVLITDGNVTPEMFGAVGDGITDDTTSLQKCVNHASIIHALGRYKISAGIEMHSNLCICGFGKGTILKDANTTVHFASLYYYATDHADVEISNVTLDGLVMTGLQHWTGQTLSGKANDIGIRMVVNNCRVINCILSEFGGCAITIGGNDNHIENNTISYSGTFTGDPPNYNFGISYRGTGTVITGNSISGVIQGIISGLVNTDTVISNNDISTNGQHGLYMESGINVVVDSNTIHDCSICGIKFQLADEALTVFEDIVISNNVIKNCGGQGVFIIDLVRSAKTIQQVIIDSNIIDKCQRCVQIGAAYNVEISNNIISPSAPNQYGIYLGIVENYSIMGNRIAATDCNGIVQSADLTNPEYNQYGFISENVIMVINDSNTGYFALRMHHGKNVSITGNKFHFSGTNTASDGIYISGSTSGNITDMYILNNIASGFRWDLRVTAPDGVTIDGNFFKTKTGI